MRRPADVPVYRPNIYAARAIVDPYLHYARLRELGPVVWLSRQRVYALPRYTGCKAVLRDDKTFVSGAGVGLDPLVNRLARGTTLNSDGAAHDMRRKLVARRLLPRALRAMADSVDERAAVAQREVDGVRDLASALPLAVVPDSSAGRRQHLLRWGGSTFDALGPVNRYTIKAIPASLEMMRFSKRVVRHRSVLEGSMGHDLLVAADGGKVPHAECQALMIDYLVPSLDTTISGIASALALFAAHPKQWGRSATTPG